MMTNRYQFWLYDASNTQLQQWALCQLIVATYMKEYTNTYRFLIKSNDGHEHKILIDTLAKLNLAPTRELAPSARQLGKEEVKLRRTQAHRRSSVDHLSRLFREPQGLMKKEEIETATPETNQTTQTK